MYIILDLVSLATLCHGHFHLSPTHTIHTQGCMHSIPLFNLPGRQAKTTHAASVCQSTCITRPPVQKSCLCCCGRHAIMPSHIQPFSSWVLLTQGHAKPVCTGHTNPGSSTVVICTPCVPCINNHHKQSHTPEHLSYTHAHCMHRYGLPMIPWVTDPRCNESEVRDSLLQAVGERPPLLPQPERMML